MCAPSLVDLHFTWCKDSSRGTKSRWCDFQQAAWLGMSPRPHSSLESRHRAASGFGQKCSLSWCCPACCEASFPGSVSQGRGPERTSPSVELDYETGQEWGREFCIQHLRSWGPDLHEVSLPRLPTLCPSPPALLCLHMLICARCVPGAPLAGVLIMPNFFAPTTAQPWQRPYVPLSFGSFKGSPLRLGCRVCGKAGCGSNGQPREVGWGQGGSARPALSSAQASHCTVRARPLKRESSSVGCSRSEV